MNRLFAAVLLSAVCFYSSSEQVSAQTAPTIRITVVNDSEGVNRTAQGPVLTVPAYGKVIAISNAEAYGRLPNGGYVWNDDPSNPSPGMNEELVAFIAWVTPNIFDVWLSVEKFYLPTKDIFPRGFGPEVALRVTISHKDGKPQLLVQNKQTKMGFLQFNVPGGDATLPQTLKDRQLSGVVWTTPDGTQLICGLQTSPETYTAMRIKKPDGKFVDFVTLTLEP